MAQNNNNIESSISRLNINDINKSRTPPPPGFDGASSNNVTSTIIVDRSNSGTPKSTSYNNLAMALGSGLAESMDDSTGGSGQHGLTTNNALMNGGGQQQIVRPGSTMSGGIQDMSPGRINTPDAYTRQSRHAVGRLMGSGSGGGKRR
mgnify:CR=1 FL=1